MSGVAADEEALVLVVDDDQRLRSLLARYLAEHGFRVVAAENAAEARARLALIEPEAMVLDISMPGEDGLALTQSLRAARARVPILLLTARGASEDRIAGFEAGADDYLPKPFEPRELLLRLRALMRRATPATTEPPVSVRLGALTFDAARGELTGPAGVVRLTGGEAALLGELARHAGEALSRESIAGSLGMDEASERAIDVQVTRLRRKIEPDPREPRFLFTVRGRGYVLKPGT
jgi:two-component system, OmpR family, phosphate regulon response regulator OmpR